ncbi:MAG: hypothetical protein WAJ93_05080, partial [Candidatus Nitrosopolaris sp.]
NYMTEDVEKKKWFINNIDCILQIRLDEFKSDRESAVSYSVRYREVLTTFRSKIFGSAAVIATILVAIVAFKVLQPYVNIALILLIIDLAIVGAAEYGFSKHSRKSAKLWYELDQKYVSAITYINKERIFLDSTRLRIDSVKPEQLDLLVSYTSVTLGRYCIGIIDRIEEVQRFSRYLRYVKEILAHLSERQKILLSDAYDKYKLRKDAFEREKQFLSDLPLDFNSELQHRITCILSVPAIEMAEELSKEKKEGSPI